MDACRLVFPSGICQDEKSEKAVLMRLVCIEIVVSKFLCVLCPVDCPLFVVWDSVALACGGR